MPMARDAKVDPKEMATEAFYAAKEFAEGLLADFKSQDRFFKYKAGILSAWLVTSCSTVVLAWPAASGPKNALRAEVRMSVVVDTTSMLVKNLSSEDWKDVRLTLDDKFTSFFPLVKAGDKVVVAVIQFVGPTGQVPPKKLKPNSLRIACSEGTTDIDLNAPPPPP